MCASLLPVLLAGLFFILQIPAPLVLGQEKTISAEDYEREEAGVNPYTAPSLAKIFQQLDDLKPLPFDELKRDLPPTAKAGREQMGIIFGALIADGFLLVESERKDLVDDLGRALLRQARSLGVGDRVVRHSASLTELARGGDWVAVRKELTATQADVEEAMVELRDQKMVHLISLGGWLRGLEISSGAVARDFSPARARVLRQPALVDYFTEELKTLPPPLAQTLLFQKLRAGLTTLQAVFRKASPQGLTIAEVQTIHEKARELNLAFLQAR